MNRSMALPYVSAILDDALNVQVELSDAGHEIPEHAVLVGWQCGFEPMFVAVKSYLPNVVLSSDEAVEIAVDYLREIGWFAQDDSGYPDVNEPDYVIRPIVRQLERPREFQYDRI